MTPGRTDQLPARTRTRSRLSLEYVRVRPGAIGLAPVERGERVEIGGVEREVVWPQILPHPLGPHRFREEIATMVIAIPA